MKEKANYIGKKFYKTETGYLQQEYSACAKWCNETQSAVIKDMGDYYECVAVPQPTAEEQAQSEISQLKQYLADTDYCAIKCAELGLSMANEYPEIYQKRIASRARINELEQSFSIT